MCIYLPISPPPSPFLLPISLSSFTCYLLPPPLPHTSFSPTRSPLSFISFFLFLFDLYTLSFSYYSFIYLLLFPSSISSFFTASIVLCFSIFLFLSSSPLSLPSLSSLPPPYSYYSVSMSPFLPYPFFFFLFLLIFSSLPLLFLFPPLFSSLLFSSHLLFLLSYSP